MKKICLFLAIVMLFLSLASCSSGLEPVPAETTPKVTTTSKPVLKKTEEILKRYRFLCDALADSSVIADIPLWRSYSKEHADIQETAEKYEEYLNAEKEMKDAFELAETETDSEMKKLLLAVLLLSVAVYGADAKVKGKVLEGKRIELKTDVPGAYTLVYEGAGRQQLAGYAPICTLDAGQLAHYEDFIDANVAPYGAKAIGVYDSENNRVGAIKIASLKSKSAKAPLYTYGVLTDVHFGVPKIDPVYLSQSSSLIPFFVQSWFPVVVYTGIFD